MSSAQDTESNGQYPNTWTTIYKMCNALAETVLMSNVKTDSYYELVKGLEVIDRIEFFTVS